MQRQKVRFERLRPADVLDGAPRGPKAEALDLPVPPGFLVDATTWGSARTDLGRALASEVSALERRTGRRLRGRRLHRLVLSVSPATDPAADVLTLHQDGGRRLVEAVDAATAAALDGAEATGAAARRPVVRVQMVPQGVLDERSGVGRAFSRDPVSGSPGLYGYFVAGSQDVDAAVGREPIERAARRIPQAFGDLEGILTLLEAVYRDMCAVDFTVESGHLWITRVRRSETRGVAAVRVAVDLVDEGLVDVDSALERIPLAALEVVQAPVFARRQDLDVLARGVPAAPGGAVGTAVFDEERAMALAADGEPVVLILDGAGAVDGQALAAAEGVVMTAGSPVATAAVIARRLGRPTVCEAADLGIDRAARRARTRDGRTLREGDPVSVDGREGIVAAGRAELVLPQPSPRMARLLGWCEERQRVRVLRDAPPGLSRVRTAEELRRRRGGGPLLLDVPPDTLPELTEELADAGEVALLLRAPLGVQDLHPPPARWDAVVAPPMLTWAARLLATRFEVLEPQTAISSPGSHESSTPGA